MNLENFKSSEEEVLLAFAVEPTHDRKTLERYLREYPEHSIALVECSIELMLDVERNNEVMEVVETAVDQAWQKFQTAMNVPGDISVSNPFATLNQASFKSVSEKLGINKLLLTRFRDRAIDVATIPQCFLQKLAAELNVTVNALLTYLNSPPSMVSNHSFRSATKPAVTDKVSFDQAIETSSLTPTQQAALKALKD